MKSRAGFLMAEAMICIAITSTLCLWSVALMRIELKKQELFETYEEGVNASWEQVIANLEPCPACPVIKEEESEDPS